MQILAQETTGEPRLRKWFNRDNLIILVLAGILLFVIALPIKGESDTDVLPEADSSLIKGSDAGTEKNRGASGIGSMESDTAWNEYAGEQEAKLEALLASMEGVGEVEVMLTFVSSEELVVEKDAPTVRSNTVEKDSAGGSRTVSQFESGDTTVYSNISGESTPYVVKTINPRVEGVLVVAQGAADGEVSRNITEAVQALYGVEAHRVKVVDMGGRSSDKDIVTGLSGN